MIKIIYNENYANVKIAVEMAQQLLDNQSFYNAIMQKNQAFDSKFTNATPSQIANSIMNCDRELYVQLYWPNIFQRNRKANAYTDIRYPNYIFLNMIKADNDYPSLAATLIHECVHVADYYDQNLIYNHGDNNWRGKENSPPYWIDNLAYNMLTKNSNQNYYSNIDSIN